MPATNASTSPPAAASAALRMLALLFMAAGLIFTVADPDLWGHLRFGLDILEAGRVVTAVDRYSFTADRPFVYHEWLGGTIMALVYRSAGTLGLQLFKAGLGALLFLIIASGLRRATFAWRWTALSVAALGALPIVWTIRPQMWSLLGIAIVTRIVMSPAPAPWVLLGLPALFALWANLHGGWIVGGAILAIFAVCALFGQGPRRWMLFGAGGLSLVATLATPYGVGLWLFLAETVRFSRTDIAEWLPVWRVGWGSLGLWLIPAVLCVVTLRGRRIQVAAGLTLAVLALAAAFVDRVVPLFTVAAVTLLRPYWDRQQSVTPAPNAGRLILDGIAIAVAMAAVATVRGPATCIAINGDFAPDTAAAESLRGRTGKLVVYFDWGEYALWQFGPRLQVSLDGRRETVYREDTLKAQQAIARGTPLGLRTLEQMRADYVWLPIRSPARTWLESHGYRIDVVTARSFVSSRSDLPPLVPWTGRPSGCFPGP